ncbi:N-acetylglutaminylglutamine amidotransferase [Zooshikella ganghwensis]|uniref:asparagine synthase (glutamine-hydrolyzing) n=1 Tax=Zooshikella ganghwensis TaxID=202772 RepID=A0A4P9VQ79_9GAMM|nr:N-acetylglutaminylglutamine amidotransferase [Zooshikella ganghwensis]RDH44232.1 N-acetylglutaminylglutamine amidotransferase [Zooshikella ganghwensis]
MCGIAGEFRFDQQVPDLNFASVANSLQASRGPDASGIFAQNNQLFAHRRLKIMDLSSEAQQPMVDMSLGLGIVFNGAIYNYREIRKRLIDQGYHFFSDVDTEVVLKAYHAWGKKCLDRFNGMFAFAIWRIDGSQLFLARDRLGIKPCYYVQNHQFFRFASFLPTLLHSAQVSHELDPIALQFYLNFHAVVPAPSTLFKDIRKLPPGHWLEVDDNGGVQQGCWWQVNYERTQDHEVQSVDDWQMMLQETLLQSVRRRNVAAVDVGVLLSGGVDSSLLVALLAEVKGSDIQTFSVGFDSVGNEAGDEFQYSDIVARQFGTTHHRWRVSEQELLNTLPQAIKAMAEPMVSHDCIGFYLLAQEVVKHCHAVQSGQGADEIFAGYHWYPPLLAAKEAYPHYRQAFFDRDFSEYKETVSAAWFVDNDDAGDWVKAHFAEAGAPQPLDKALRLDTTVMLVEDPVKRVDNMTMAHGLEARVPFLDHELVELVAKMPSTMKIQQGDGKWLLKRLARQWLPSEVIDRPKGYFPVPALKYLKGTVLNQIIEALQQPQAKQRALFNPSYLNRLYQDPGAHITPLRGSKLWQLGLLELWLQAQGI